MDLRRTQTKVHRYYRAPTTNYPNLDGKRSRDAILFACDCFGLRRRIGVSK